ncbi:MAG: DNA methyltransferase, partial [Nitrospirota bacterium]|nr:DNA methyltransferase [Nitrospirota bacterium]
MKHPAKMSWELLERIFKHLESMNLLTPDSIVIDFMAGTGRTNIMAALRGYRTISVELEPHFIEMIAGYDCDGRRISDFRIKPCVCGSEILHKPHKIRTGLFEVECSGNPRIVPVCRCGNKIHHKKHHIPGNRELLEKVTGRKVKWDVIQGDARESSKLLDESGLVGVVSPPYTYQVAFQDKEFIKSIAEDKSQRVRDGRMGGHFATPEAIKRSAEKIMEKYSQDPRNIGNLKDVPLVGIMSPPYQDSLCSGTLSYENAKKMAMAMYEKHGRSFSQEDLEHQIKLLQERSKKEYSSDLNNIGNLKDVPLVGIMSPPFLEAQTGGGIAIKGYEGKYYYDQGNPDRVGERCGYVKARQGTSEGQIGNLPDKPLVGITSSPYQNKVRFIEEGVSNAWNEKGKGAHENPTGYGDTPGQIGTLPDETFLEGQSYLSAMFRVYQQAFLCGISPLVVVTKNPTRNGKLRRLDLDTIFLLQACGYEIFDYHRAVLFESHKQETLSGDTKDIHKGRISFFKRLSLEKGTTVAQWEDIIFAR